jgi:dTDP-glucose 4,6-dehydratase
MRLLVTGGCGFVMSSVVLTVLSTDASASAIILDLREPDDFIRASFSPYEDRVKFVSADVSERTTLDALALDAVTHVVHGASVTSFPDAEIKSPERFINVNVIGTMNVLRWVSTMASITRVVNVSSGAVYGDPTPASPETPQPEEGPFNPPEFYAISKYASERAAHRCGQLFEVDVRSVRLSDVFGPMERPTSVRQKTSLPYKLAQAETTQQPLRMTSESADGGGDFISSDDVATAVAALLRKTSLTHDVYNVAYGTFTTCAQLLEAFAATGHRVPVELVDCNGADVSLDPRNRRARWNAYATARIAEETGWHPRPLVEQVASYIEWLSTHPIFPSAADAA